MTFPRILMTASALFLAVLGLPCMFAPEVVLLSLTDATTTGAEILVQLTGSLYMGFAAVNWMSKGSLMGGIYGRPLAIGNLLHFVAGALALIKAASATDQAALAWPVAIGYASFAVGFGLVVFRNPVAATKDSA
jgi:hypothetical protein